MLPPAVTYRGRFPRTLVDFHSFVISVSSTVSSRILDLLVQIITATRKRAHDFRCSTSLDVIEGIIGAKRFLYLSEAAVAGEFAFLLVVLCISRRGVPREELELLRSNRFFLETIGSKMPHVLRWYQVISGFNLKGRYMGCRDMFKRSPSILDRTPAEATWRHSEEIARGRWRHPPAAGKVRLHFFRTYGGQHNEPQANSLQHPDVRIDLDFDSKQGINLGKARKMLGVEKLSVITGLYHRTTFDPIDRDRLSPLAVYDLSKQLCEPIRVFEPSPSRITTVKRKIHDSISLSIYLAFTLLRSCLGFTLHDHAYLMVTFGDNFAARCVRLSRAIRPFNLWAREGAWLIIQLCTFLSLLPFVIIFKATVFVQSSLFIAVRSALAFFVSLFVTVRYTLLSLPLKAQIMVVMILWITLADLFLTLRTP